MATVGFDHSHYPSPKGGGEIDGNSLIVASCHQFEEQRIYLKAPCSKSAPQSRYSREIGTTSVDLGLSSYAPLLKSHHKAEMFTITLYMDCVEDYMHCFIKLVRSCRKFPFFSRLNRSLINLNVVFIREPLLLG